MDIVPRYRFERLVAEIFDEVLEQLPDDLLGVFDNVVVRVDDRHPGEADLLGLYEGTPHTERRGDELPDVITLYRRPLCEMCENEDDLAEEIFVTIVHEVAHAAGIDDDRLEQLGWD